MGDFEVLTEHEVAAALCGIEAVARLGKPISEICERKADIDQLEIDLRQCLSLANECGVQGFIRAGR
jgi:hypothetical protein